MANEYDVAVLGAGPGGYIAAIRATQLGLKTAIIEKKYWGGVCLNVGCIPSKALLYNAELAHIIKQEAKTFGILIDGEVKMDYGAAYKRSRQVSNRLVKGVQFLMKKNKVDTYEGWATLTDDHNITVELNEGGTEQITFKHLIVAAGAVDNLLPGMQFSDNVVSWETQILEDHLPEKIVIVGAGAIGTEFSYVMANYGVDVTIVEFMDRMLPNEDEEVSKELMKHYDKMGVNLMMGHRVEQVDDQGDKVVVTVTERESGETKTIEAERAMIATGFRARTEGYGLENTGVQLTERGAIDINERMQTNVPHIYAIGDVTGKLMLAHVAEVMGVVAAENIAGVESQELEFIMMPRATYCQPQVASFGYTEAQAREKGMDINVAKFPFQANGKALGLNEGTGFVKLISDKQYGEIIGAHMIGPNVTELLPELTLAASAELTPDEVARNVHAHPTLSEAVKEAAHGLEGHMLNM